MSNETLPATVPAAPVTDNENVEVKKEAKITKWFNLAGIILQALAGIFSRKN